jgi:hypothetical protein
MNDGFVEEDGCVWELRWNSVRIGGKYKEGETALGRGASLIECTRLITGSGRVD